MQDNERSIKHALLLTIKNMYKPCLFAALTTIFAFATLYTSGIKPVMDFGLMMCVGLIITYITSFSFLPVVIFLLNLNTANHTYLNQRESIFASLAIKSPNILLTLFIFIFCLGIYGATKLKVENSFVDYFKEETEIYKGMKLIDDKLGGTTPLDVVINFNSVANDTIEEDFEEDFLDFGIEYDPADYWFTEEKVNVIKKFMIT